MDIARRRKRVGPHTLSPQCTLALGVLALKHLVVVPLHPEGSDRVGNHRGRNDVSKELLHRVPQSLLHGAILE